MNARTLATIRRLRLSLSVLLLVSALVLIPASPVLAATVTVTTNTDSNNACAADGTTAPCSIRDAVAYANANAGTTISIPADTYNLTLGGDPTLTANTTITGAGAKTTIIDAGHTSRVFQIGLGATVSISGLTMRNGSSDCCTFDGGGNIYTRGTLTILNSTISGGASNQDGGGISNGNTGAGGALTVINSTINGNTASGGGAIKNDAGASVTITNSTLTGNNGDGQGVLMGNRGPFILTHVTLAGNSSVGSYTFGVGNTSYTNSINTNGCAGNKTSGGYNIDSGTSCAFGQTGDQSSTNPSLGSLQDNGGTTQTMAITSSSPAYNKIPNSGANCTATDQRSVARPQPANGLCDVGAFEVTIIAAATLGMTNFPSPQTAGVAGTVTVTAKDQLGNVVPTYTGTVTFTSNDPLATIANGGLPANYTFVANDNGVHTFSVTLKTATTTASITATDTTLGTITGTQSNITITATAATTLTVAGHASSVVAGTPGTVTVTLRDTFNNIATGYTGTVRFTSSDAQATKPGDYLFTGGDAGVHTFTNGITLKTAGTQSITATDIATPALTSTQSGITVTTGAPSQFLVTGYPSPAQANASNTFAVIAKDAFGNTASAYGGTAHFTSSDAQAVLPADYPFTPADAGIHFFAATLKSLGTRSILATDTVTASIAGLQSITVVAGPVSGVAASGGATPQNAIINQAFTNALGVTVTDASSNPVVNASITFVAPASGPRGTFAGNSATATVTTNGSGVATAPTFTAGTVSGSFTVSVIVPGGTTFTPFTLTNLPDAADHFTVTGTSSATAGSAFTLTVTALDTFGNTATGYTGTVHFTSTDPQATSGNGLPADYPFTSGSGLDNGVHTFTNGVTLKTAGNRSVTASQSTLTGSLSVAVTAAAAATITANGSSTPQTATVGTAFGNLLAATVLDGFGNSVGGVSVTFTAPGGAPSGAFAGGGSPVAITNGGGVATAPAFTANTTAGGYTVIASAPGVGTPATFSLTNSAGAPGSIAVNAGSPQSATVNATFGTALAALVKDASNNPVPNVVVTFIAPSSAATGTFTGGVYSVNATTNVSGVATAVTFKANTTAGSFTVSASAPGVGSPASFTLTNTPGAAASLTITALANPAQAGIATGFTVTAKDTFGNTATGYTGTVHFTSTDPLATSGNGLPGDYLFTSGDAGVHSFSATFKTVGARTLTATDSANSLTANQPTQVLAGPVASFTVSDYPSPVAVNVGNAFTVIAKDALGNTASGYTGTVTFSSTDGQIVKPADYPFIPADQGAHTFAATFKTVGAQTLTAKDSVTSSITGSQSGISVTAATPTHLTVSAPGTAQAGATISVVVTAKDAADNTVTNYTRTVHFTSSDVQAVLPGDYTFVAADNGVHTFSVTLKLAGSQTITATDLGIASITGNAAVTVSGPTVAKISPISGPPTGGTTVTITGTNLTGATVSIGGVNCGSVVVAGGGGSLTCATGSHPTAATVDVVVTPPTPRPSGGTVSGTPPSPLPPVRP